METRDTLTEKERMIEEATDQLADLFVQMIDMRAQKKVKRSKIINKEVVEKHEKRREI